MNYQRVYLDLDRTLLDTPKFSAALFAAVEQEYHIAADLFHRMMPNYYRKDGDLQYYDFFAQITHLGLQPKTVTARLQQLLYGQDFIYPDAHHLLAALKTLPVTATILSYGPSNYQQFKFSLLPPASHLPFTATLQPKGEYLAAQTPEPSAIVDDKLITPLPQWCTQYLIDRTALAPSILQGERTLRINSLAVVESAVRVGYNEPNQTGNTYAAD